MRAYAMGCSRRNPCISPRELMVNNEMRMLWEQHVYWTRLFISGAVFGSPDVKVTEGRLLRNPKDFAMVLRPVYGEKEAEEFEKLFTAHLEIAGRLVTALKIGDTVAADAARKEWYENADELAAFLTGINPCWSLDEWKNMFYSHLELTEKEAEEFIKGDYEASVLTFDTIEMEALEMADMMTRGIMMQ